MVTRRRFLGGLGLAGAAGGLAAVFRSRGGYGPSPAISAGTVRLVESYGDLPLQQGEWWVPPGAAAGRLPTVVLVHGGYWGPGYDRHLEDAVAADLAGRGFLVWNVDYRAADHPWPATLTDVAAAYDHAARSARVDTGSIAVVGHSAGGHLALWLASRRAPFAPADGVPRPRLAVGQAPVAALAAGVPQGLGGGAVVRLLGGTPEQVPDRYAQADPMALLPSGTRTVLIHSTADAAVPLSQSETYRAAATGAGDDCTLERVGGDHYAHLDPASQACDRLRDALLSLG